MDFLLMGFDQSLSDLITVLENSTVSNTTKAVSMMASLGSDELERALEKFILVGGRLGLI